MFDKAMVQIYTGKGKGKTTAAVGSAIRAAGHGGKVLFYQFLKPANLDLGERKALESLDNITVETIDDPWDMAEHIAGKEEAKLMAENQIRRLPIIENGTLVGIVSLGDLAVNSSSDMEAGEALSSISIPAKPEK